MNWLVTRYGRDWNHVAQQRRQTFPRMVLLVIVPSNVDGYPIIRPERRCRQAWASTVAMVSRHYDSVQRLLAKTGLGQDRAKYPHEDFQSICKKSPRSARFRRKTPNHPRPILPGQNRLRSPEPWSEKKGSCQRALLLLCRTVGFSDPSS